MKWIFALLIGLSISTIPAFAQEQSVKVILSNPAMESEIHKQGVSTGDISVPQSILMTQDQFSSLIHFQKTPIPINSKLKRKYQGYKIDIFSDCPDPLSLTSATVMNGFSGTAAAGSLNVSPLIGFAGGPLGALIVSPIVFIHNKQAEEEGLSYSNQIPLKKFNQGDSLTFNSLVLIGQNPEIRLSFKDMKTNQTFSINSQI